MTDRLSTPDPRGQQPQPKNRPIRFDVLHYPMDLHAETVSVPLPVPIPISVPDPDVIDAMIFPDRGERDAADDSDDGFDHDGDTVTAPDGHDDDDLPPAGAAALTISAPSGAQPVRPGYTIAAVVMGTDEDGEENPLDFQFLTNKKLQTERMARGLATYKALHPRKLSIPATHIVVNDETGREVFRRPVLRAA